MLILEFPSAYFSQFEIPLIVSGLKSHPASLSMSYAKRGCIIRPFLMLSLRKMRETGVFASRLDEDYDDDEALRLVRAFHSHP